MQFELKIYSYLTFQIAEVASKAEPPSSDSSGDQEKDKMPAPLEIPSVIPLTEAEITKRYTDLHRVGFLFLL